MLTSLSGFFKARSINKIYNQALNGNVEMRDAKKAIEKMIVRITNSSQNYDLSEARKYHSMLMKLDGVAKENSNDLSAFGGGNGKNDINNGSFHYEPKSHKNFRGIRCWLSAVKNQKHYTNDVENSYTNYAKNIMNTLAKKDNSIVLLSFGKSEHSTIAIHHGNNKFSYISMHYDKVSNNYHKFVDKVSQDLVTQFVANDMTNCKDGLQDNNLVYLHNLNVEKVNNYILKNKDSFKFNLISNNCSRFSANALLAGVEGKSSQFQHNRKCQMPANTLELAKEIAAYTGQ
ncbi:Uncharacterised protein [Yersinia massiliensis]|uniref:hypothetical protein n=1 Tax=Yersinia massiliensis TaxID=419257 RepID=UPI0005E09751|nr:hypothetical protein [Yersinia massiliensis]CNH59968.1 Uncharacterised protein [Yersinia massiliensis]